jgi:hypothetical protein
MNDCHRFPAKVRISPEYFCREFMALNVPEEKAPEPVIELTKPLSVEADVIIPDLPEPLNEIEVREVLTSIRDKEPFQKKNKRGR